MALNRRGAASKPKAAPAKSFSGMATHNAYHFEKKLGEGTFGIVYKGEKTSERKLVAVKRILQRDIGDTFPITAFREITILRRLRNDYLVELVDVIVDKPGPTEEKTDLVGKGGKAFYLVFPYMSYDLTGILQNDKITLTVSDNKSIMMQLFKGLHFMHSKNFLHRDIKASNILINSNGLLKIGDFGLARSFNPPALTKNSPGGGRDQLTEVVMTRWYRAPEVLIGNRRYTTAVDLWACGCILGELYEKKPILPGKSDVQQAYDIFALVGSPNQRTMPGVEDFLTKYPGITPSSSTIRQRFESKMGPEAADLMEKLMLLDAQRRYTAEKALEHEWLTSAEPLPTDRVKVDFPDCHEADVISKRQQEPKSRPSLPPSNPQTGNAPRPLPAVPTYGREPEVSQVPSATSGFSHPPRGAPPVHAMANADPQVPLSGPPNPYANVNVPKNTFLPSKKNDTNDNANSYVPNNSYNSTNQPHYNKGHPHHHQNHHNGYRGNSNNGPHNRNDYHGHSYGNNSSLPRPSDPLPPRPYGGNRPWRGPGNPNPHGPPRQGTHHNQYFSQGRGPTGDSWQPGKDEEHAGYGYKRQRVGSDANGYNKRHDNVRYGNGPRGGELQYDG